MFKAHEARTKNYRKTEMWRPPEAHAPMGELDRAARDLSHVRQVDIRDCHRHVGAGANNQESLERGLPQRVVIGEGVVW
jgi:hypothetical protein